MSYSTQLTDINNYDINRIIFSQPQKNTVNNSPLTYQRVNISTKNEDGTIGDLILKTPVLYSFGVQESKNMDMKSMDAKNPNTKETNGYVMPIRMWDRNNPSAEEKAWTDMFDKICNRCKEYLVENRNEIGKWDLEMNDLKKFNPLHWKRDKTTGKVVPGTGPTLYAKLISSKRDKAYKILSVFYDADTCEDINPLDILEKHCQVTAAIKIESIFIGNRLSLQVKLWEVEVRLAGTGKKRLLKPSMDNYMVNKPIPKSIEAKPTPFTEDSGSLNPSDDEEDTQDNTQDLHEEKEDNFVPQTQPSPPTKTGRALKGRLRK